MFSHKMMRKRHEILHFNPFKHVRTMINTQPHLTSEIEIDSICKGKNNNNYLLTRGDQAGSDPQEGVRTRRSLYPVKSTE
jgi:hypothetical protein